MVFSEKIRFGCFSPSQQIVEPFIALPELLGLLCRAAGVFAGVHREAVEFHRAMGRERGAVAIDP